MKATRASFELVTAQSMASSSTSPAYSIIEIDVEALQVNYSGSPVGAFSVEGSCDFQEDTQGNILNPGNWVTLYFTVNGTLTNSVPVPTDPSPIIFDLYGTGIPWLRLVYTATSGSGSYNAFATGKRLGD